jgi:hypothetical protein
MTGVREAGQEKDPEGIFRPAPKEKTRKASSGSWQAL